MKVGQLIAMLQKLAPDTEVHIGVTFVRDTREDEGYAYGPAVRIVEDGTTVVLQGSEDADVAVEDG